MAERMVYARFNTEEGVTGKYVLTGIPGHADFTVTETYPCPHPLPESYVKKAKLHTETFHVAKRANRPARDVRRFRFGLTPWPAPEAVAEAEEELVVEGTDAIPLDAQPVTPAQEPTEAPKGRGRGKAPASE